jgi:hypothetical protein
MIFGVVMPLDACGEAETISCVDIDVLLHFLARGGVYVGFGQTDELYERNPGGAFVGAGAALHAIEC